MQTWSTFRWDLQLRKSGSTPPAQTYTALQRRNVRCRLHISPSSQSATAMIQTETTNEKTSASKDASENSTLAKSRNATTNSTSHGLRMNHSKTPKTFLNHRIRSEE